MNIRKHFHRIVGAAFCGYCMREDIQTVEKIRKTADKLARSEKSRHRGQEPER